MGLTIIWILLLFVLAVVVCKLFRISSFKWGEALYLIHSINAAENHGVEAAVSHLSRLFEHAQHEILIVSDDLGPDCWSNTNVTLKLLKAVMNGTANGKIIVGPDFNLNHVQKDLRQVINSGLLKVRKLNYRPKGHFVIVDSRSVRLEEPHKPGSKKLKAKTFWAAPIIARKMRTHFEKLWELGVDLEVDNDN